jgi:putative NADH-flavin reductase
MKILVIGASGPTGKEIVKQAMEHGHAITAFARDAAKLKPALLLPSL